MGKTQTSLVSSDSKHDDDDDDDDDDDGDSDGGVECSHPEISMFMMFG